MKAEFAIYSLNGGEPDIYEYFDWKEDDEDYVRCSDVVEVEIEEWPREKTIPLRAKGFDARIERVRAEMNEKINRLEDEKAKLLAITHERD